MSRDRVGLITEAMKGSLLRSKSQRTTLVPTASAGSPVVLHLHKWPHGVTVLSCWVDAARLGRCLPTVCSAEFWLREKTSLSLEATWALRGEGPHGLGKAEEQQISSTVTSFHQEASWGPAQMPCTDGPVLSDSPTVSAHLDGCGVGRKIYQSREMAELCDFGKTGGHTPQEHLVVPVLCRAPLLVLGFRTTDPGGSTYTRQVANPPAGQGFAGGEAPRE